MRIPLKAAISLLAIVLLAACTGTPSGTVPHETATHTVSTATQSAPTAPVATGATLAAVSTRKPALGCASGDVTLKVYFDPVAQYCLLYPARFPGGGVPGSYHNLRASRRGRGAGPGPPRPTPVSRGLVGGRRVRVKARPAHGRAPHLHRHPGLQRAGHPPRRGDRSARAPRALSLIHISEPTRPY